MKNLVKNQEVNLVSEIGSNLFTLAFSWNEPLTYEVDVSAVLLSENRMLEQEDNFIFYNNPSSTCQSVVISPEPRNLYKSSIDIDLNKIPQDVSEVLFLLSIYDANRTKKNFSEIEHIRIDLFKPDKKDVLFRYDLNSTKENKSIISIIIMRLHKVGKDWILKCDGYMLLLELDDILMKFVSKNVKITQEQSRKKMIKEKKVEFSKKQEVSNDKKIPSNLQDFLLDEFSNFDKRVIEIESLIKIYDLKINELFKKILDLLETKTKDMEHNLVKHTTELFMTLIENIDVVDQRSLQLEQMIRKVNDLNIPEPDEKKYLELSEKISNLETKFETYEGKLDKLTDGIGELLEFAKKENEAKKIIISEKEIIPEPIQEVKEEILTPIEDTKPLEKEIVTELIQEAKEEILTPVEDTKPLEKEIIPEPIQEVKEEILTPVEDTKPLEKEIIPEPIQEAKEEILTPVEETKLFDEIVTEPIQEAKEEILTPIEETKLFDEIVTEPIQEVKEEILTPIEETKLFDEIVTEPIQEVKEKILTPVEETKLFDEIVTEPIQENMNIEEYVVTETHKKNLTMDEIITKFTKIEEIIDKNIDKDEEYKEPLKLEEEEKLCFSILLENISIDEDLLKEKIKEHGFQGAQVKGIIFSLIKKVNNYVRNMDEEYDELIEVIKKMNKVIYTLSDLKFAKYISSKIA